MNNLKKNLKNHSSKRQKTKLGNALKNRWMIAGLTLVTLVPCVSFSDQLPCKSDGNTVIPQDQISNLSNSLKKVNQKNDVAMDKLFKYYTVACSLSQLEPINGTPGGAGGHALMYIKGACRDMSVSYPKLKLCEPGDPTDGTGLSFDKILANSYYVPTDGKDFLFNGDLKPGEALDAAAKERTVQAIIATGSLAGIKIHPELLKPRKGESMNAYIARGGKQPNESDEHFIARVGVDTDYAISFAREAKCENVFMDKEQVQAEIDKVNSDNAKLKDGKVAHWNGPGDNCTDYVRNVMAAAGIRDSEFTGSNMLIQGVKLATFRTEIPRNETTRTVEVANNLSDINTADKVYDNEKLRKDFNDFNTLPHMGALHQDVPMIEPNQIYEKAKREPIFVQVPGLDNRSKDLKKIESDPNYTDLAHNLMQVRERLQLVQSERKPVAADDISEKAIFARKYNAWVDSTLNDINSKLTDPSLQ